QIDRDLTWFHLVRFHEPIERLMVFRDTGFECRGILLEVEHGVAKHPFAILARSRFDSHHHTVPDKLGHLSSPFRPTDTSLAWSGTIETRTRCYSSDTGHAIAARTCRALNSRAGIGGRESVSWIPPPHLLRHRLPVFPGREERQVFCSPSFHSLNDCAH